MYWKNLMTFFCFFAVVASLPSGAFANERDKSNHRTTDMVPQALNPGCVRVKLSNAIFADAENFVLRPEFQWKDSGLKELFQGADPDPETAYIVHVTVWTLGIKGPELNSSDWYSYRRAKVDIEGRKDIGLKQWYTSTNTGDLPLVYGARAVEVIAVQKVDKTLADQLQLTYQVTPSQGTPENTANVGRVFSAVFGLQSGTSKTAELMADVQDKKDWNACAERLSIKGTSLLPYDLSIKMTYGQKQKNASSASRKGNSVAPLEDSESLGPGAGRGDDASSARVMLVAHSSKSKESTSADGAAAKDDSSSSSISRTIHVLDKEWWDLNLSMAIPGIREARTTRSTDGTITGSVTRHVDPYGFVSVYPLASRWPKNSFAPHFDFGLPFSGQPLHRSFAGVSEKIPGLEKIVGLPISVFAGSVFLKEQRSTIASGTKGVDAATFVQSLHESWVRKGAFGLEFSVSSLINKIGKK